MTPIFSLIELGLDDLTRDLDASGTESGIGFRRRIVERGWGKWWGTPASLFHRNSENWPWSTVKYIESFINERIKMVHPKVIYFSINKSYSCTLNCPVVCKFCLLGSISAFGRLDFFSFEVVTFLMCSLDHDRVSFLSEKGHQPYMPLDAVN